MDEERLNLADEITKLVTAGCNIEIHGDRNPLGGVYVRVSVVPPISMVAGGTLPVHAGYRAPDEAGTLAAQLRDVRALLGIG